MLQGTRFEDGWFYNFVTQHKLIKFLIAISPKRFNSYISQKVFNSFISQKTEAAKEKRGTECPYNQIFF